MINDKSNFNTTISPSQEKKPFNSQVHGAQSREAPTTFIKSLLLQVVTNTRVSYPRGYDTSLSFYHAFCTPVQYLENNHLYTFLSSTEYRPKPFKKLSQKLPMTSIPKYVKKEIKRLYSFAMSQRKIAQEMGVCKYTVQRITAGTVREGSSPSQGRPPKVTPRIARSIVRAAKTPRVPSTGDLASQAQESAGVALCRETV
ncbi:hypothetical protein PAPHI01_2184 [Pancytospora philotis]|nr:hypothetical protein PAPHI01_2184 [Pancytospora philotis]